MKEIQLWFPGFFIVAPAIVLFIVIVIFPVLVIIPIIILVPC